MNNLDQYVIPLKGLEEGQHSYHFKINDTFFDEFDNSEIKKGKLDVQVLLDKQTNVITLEFNIQGFINTTCDLCLEHFDLNINSSNQLYIKFSENENDEDEVIYISESKHHINIAQYIYEFIHFNMPLKRVHPTDSNGESKCNIEMINAIKGFKKEESDEIDPRWEELKKIKK
ncbi:DUF177 domain-containing protein [Bacteroidota bacterium]